MAIGNYIGRRSAAIAYYYFCVRDIILSQLTTECNKNIKNLFLTYIVYKIDVILCADVHVRV